MIFLRPFTLTIESFSDADPNYMPLLTGGYVDVIQQLSAILTTLDCVCALASAAVSAPVPYVRPTVTLPGEDASLVLEQCRHPCLELLDTVAFIPNDCTMGTG